MKKIRKTCKSIYGPLPLQAGDWRTKTGRKRHKAFVSGYWGGWQKLQLNKTGQKRDKAFVQWTLGRLAKATAEQILH